MTVWIRNILWGLVFLSLFAYGSRDLRFEMRKAGAQTANPTAEEIAEQLRPKTRSLGQKRNLVISKEPDQAQGAPAAESNSSGSQATPQTASSAVTSGATTTPQAAASISLLIQFDFNSARLTPEGESALQELAKALQTEDLKEDRFLLEGHTDAKGPKDVNLRLSKMRAESVREFLVKNGIDKARLATEGYGANKLANNANPFAAENRRVRVVNLE